MTEPERNGPPRRGAGALPVAVLVLAAAAIVAPALASGETFVFRDLVDVFYPAKTFFRDAVRDGEPPFWDPYIHAGAPFLPHPHTGVFQPPNWLHAAMPIERAYPLFVLFHLVVAALGGRALGRAWGLPAEAAATIGLAFALSGYLVATIEVSTHLTTAAWLPALLASAHRLAVEPTSRRLAVCAAVAAMLFLGGEPHVAAASCAAAVVFAALPAASRRAAAGGALRASAGIALGAGAAAVQLLPLARLLLVSSRREGFVIETSGTHSMAPSQFSMFLAAPAGRSLEALAGIDGQHFIAALYAGGSVLAAASLALFTRRRRLAVALAATAGVGAVLSLGVNAPLFPLLYRLGPLASFRYPAKFLFLVVVAICALAGLGIEVLRDAVAARAPSRRRAWIVLPPAGVAAGAAILAALRPGEGFGRAAVPAAAVAAAAALPGRGRFGARGAAILAMAVAGADLLGAHVGLVPTGDLDELYRPTELHETIRRAAAAGPVRVWERPQVRERGEAWSRSIPYEERWRMKVRLLDGSLADLFRIESMQGGLAIWLRHTQSFQARLDQGSLPLLRLSNTGFLLSWSSVQFPGLVPAGAADGAWLYRVEGARPRAYVPERWATVTDPAEFGRLLESEEAASGRLALLRDDRPAPPPPERPVRGSARLAGRSRNRAVVEAELDAPGLVVLVESWAPGWTARSDGRGVEIHRVNLCFRGVFLPAGRHRVEFVYRPPGLRTGAAVSAASLGFLAALFFAGRGPRGRGPAQSL